MTREQQIERATAEIDRLTGEVAKLEPQYWAAYDRYLASPEDNDNDEWEEFQTLSRALHGNNHAIRAYKAQIARLNHPAAIEREAHTKTRLEHFMASKTPKQTAASRGVPAVYLSENGSFKPGLDARFKSDIIGTVLVHENLEKAAPKGALSTFTVEQAHDFLAQFDWVKFLDKSRGARINKQEAQARKAEKAKNAAAAKKAAPKPAAKVDVPKPADTVEVKPDPKPARKPRSDKGKPRGTKAA